MIRSLILVLYGGALLVLALRSLRAQRLKERYVLLFFSIGLPFLTLAVWPLALRRISDLMRMPYHTVMILLLTGFLLLVFFELLSIVSVQERQLATLAQMVSILSEEQRRLAGRQDRAAAEATGEMPAAAASLPGAAVAEAPDGGAGVRPREAERP